MGAVLVGLASGSEAKASGAEFYAWPNDKLIDDHSPGQEIRLSSVALDQMRAECRRGARVRGPEVETGGMLFGRTDEASGCTWIDYCTGPPPDSRMSASGFQHGVSGVAEQVEYQRATSRGDSVLLGMWHTHPFGRAYPSGVDKGGLLELAGTEGQGLTDPLIVILGGDRKTWSGWMDRGEHPDAFAMSLPKDPTTPFLEDVEVGALVFGEQAWRGGWSRPLLLADDHASLIRLLLQQVFSRR